MHIRKAKLFSKQFFPVVLFFQVLLCCVPGIFHSVSAQEKVLQDSLQTLLSSCAFVRSDLNRIQHDSAGLADFYQKLWELSQGKRKTVTIAHIGDSHIQADFMAAIVRIQLQEKFGNAGRGTVFPYRVGRSNEPWNYKSRGTGKWNAARMVKPADGLRFGLAGHTLAANDTHATFQITVNDAGTLNYGFNQVRIFHSKDDKDLSFMVCDQFNCFLAKNNTDDTSSFVSSFRFDSLYHSIVIDCIAGDSSNGNLEFYGILLENDQPGVIYNMIGVNGAQFTHYNNSDFFFTQLAALQPDLVIVSLGTNEGFAPDYDSIIFQASVNQFATQLKNAAPSVNLLFTTPGDSFKRVKHSYLRNSTMLNIRNTLVNWCDTNQIACWDLYAIMGGYGSMSKWYASKLAARDRLHFSKRGYELQGYLLRLALVEGYEEYVKRKPVGQ